MFGWCEVDEWCFMDYCVNEQMNEWMDGWMDVGINDERRDEWMGTSLVVQWLRLCTSSAEATGSNPGRGPKIPHVAW